VKLSELRRPVPGPSYGTRTKKLPSKKPMRGMAAWILMGLAADDFRWGARFSKELHISQEWSMKSSIRAKKVLQNGP